MSVPPIKTRRRGCAPSALLGCGCGLLSGIGILLIFILLGVQFVHEMREPNWKRDDYAQCQQNLSYLRQALNNYHTDHHRYPIRLVDLDPHYLDFSTRLRCPLEIKGRGIHYKYTPEAKNPTDPVITCTNHGQGPLVLLQNGRLHLPSIFRK